VKTLLLLLSLTFFVQANAASLTHWNLTVVDQHILPAYQKFKASTETLHQNSLSFCQEQNQTQFEQIKTDFKISMADWQSIQHIRFGPIENALRMHRIQMWPDKRGKVAKHLRKLLAAKKIAVLKEDTFMHGSTAVQGFSALEMLLFNNSATEEFFTANKSNYRCQLLIAITSNLSNISKGLVYDWSEAKEPFRVYIQTADQGNAYYESEKEVSSTILNNLVTQLILIVDHKLDRPIGKSLNKAYGKRAESWRSRQSLKNIQHNLKALQVLYQMGFEHQLKNKELKNKELQEKVHNGFEVINKTIATIQLPIFEAVKNPGQRKLLIQLRQQTAQLKQLFSVELPKALDIPLGFNSLDGD